VQSNPKAQKLVMLKQHEGRGPLDLILRPIRDATNHKMAGADPKLVSKALYALGSLVRGCSEAQRAFVDTQV